MSVAQKIIQFKLLQVFKSVQVCKLAKFEQLVENILLFRVKEQSRKCKENYSSTNPLNSLMLKVPKAKDRSAIWTSGACFWAWYLDRSWYSSNIWRFEPALLVIHVPGPVEACEVVATHPPAALPRVDILPRIAANIAAKIVDSILGGAGATEGCGGHAWKDDCQDKFHLECGLVSKSRGRS